MFNKYLMQEVSRTPAIKTNASYSSFVQKELTQLQEQYISGRLTSEQYAIQEGLAEFVGTLKGKINSTFSAIHARFSRHPRVAASILLSVLTIAAYGKWSPAAEAALKAELAKGSAGVSSIVNSQKIKNNISHYEQNKAAWIDQMQQAIITKEVYFEGLDPEAIQNAGLEYKDILEKANLRKEEITSLEKELKDLSYEVGATPIPAVHMEQIRTTLMSDVLRQAFKSGATDLKNVYTAPLRAEVPVSILPPDKYTHAVSPDILQKKLKVSMADAKRIYAHLKAANVIGGGATLQKLKGVSTPAELYRPLLVNSKFAAFDKFGLPTKYDANKKLPPDLQHKGNELNIFLSGKTAGKDTKAKSMYLKGVIGPADLIEKFGISSADAQTILKALQRQQILAPSKFKPEQTRTGPGKKVLMAREVQYTGSVDDPLAAAKRIAGHIIDANKVNNLTKDYLPAEFAKGGKFAELKELLKRKSKTAEKSFGGKGDTLKGAGSSTNIDYLGAAPVFADEPAIVKTTPFHIRPSRTFTSAELARGDMPSKDVSDVFAKPDKTIPKYKQAELLAKLEHRFSTIIKRQMVDYRNTLKHLSTSKQTVELNKKKQEVEDHMNDLKDAFTALMNRKTPKNISAQDLKELKYLIQQEL